MKSAKYKEWMENEEKRKRDAAKLKNEGPYKPFRMNCERMPLGCVGIILLAVGAVIFGILKLLGLV